MGKMEESTYPIKWITPQVAIGYAPHSQTDIETLKAQGIKAVLNLCAECYDLHEIESGAGFVVYWLPIADEDAPEPDEAVKALEWLDSMLVQNKKVLVHCRFGIGRTGTFVTAWLLKQGYALDDALEKLCHTPAEPKSRRQWEFLNIYSRSIGKLTIQKPAYLEKRHSRVGIFFRKLVQMNQWTE